MKTNQVNFYGSSKRNSFKELEEQMLAKYVDIIRVKCWRMQAMEQSNDYRSVPSELDSLAHIYNEENSEKLYELARGNHANAKEILYVGALYHQYAGNDEQAVKYYKELAHQHKLLGNTDEYEKYSKIAEDISGSETEPS